MKVIIIEDEFRTRNAVAKIIERNCRDIVLEGWADNIADGRSLIINKKPDLVLMDIQLTDGTGFDILKSIYPINFKIIFLTAYENYAIEAIKFSAFDYLLKPFSEDELVASLHKFKTEKETDSNNQSLEVLLNNLHENSHKKIVLKTIKSIYVVPVNNIVRLEADSSYTHFILYNGSKITVSDNLKKFELDLKNHHFIRVHHTHIINIEYIVKFTKIHGGYIELMDGTTIPVSKRRKEELMKAFSNL